MSVLLLILCWWYFCCLQMYSEIFFNIYFYEQMRFQFFVAKEDWSVLLRNNSLWTVQFSLLNLMAMVSFIWTNSIINFCYFVIFLVYETCSHLRGVFVLFCTWHESDLNLLSSYFNLYKFMSAYLYVPNNLR